MTMSVVSSLSELPNLPAVYALYGGRGNTQAAAYVGVADKLRQRIRQHLLTRDSSVATGTSVVSLNPDLVTAVQWWEHADFTERVRLEAAELVAFDVLEPTLRSRGATQAQVRKLYADATFYGEMRTLFSGEPAGRLALLTLQDALERIAELERRLVLLEGQPRDPS